MYYHDVIVKFINHSLLLCVWWGHSIHMEAHLDSFVELAFSSHRYGDHTQVDRLCGKHQLRDVTNLKLYTL